MQNYQVLSALNLNQRFQDTTCPFLPFIALIDKCANQPKSPLSVDLLYVLLSDVEKYSEDLGLITEKFPQLSLINTLTLAHAWGDFLKICMKHYIKYDHLSYQEELLEKLNALIDNSKVEHGFIVFPLDMEAIDLPCHSAMRNIAFNNLELSLFLNTGALEIAVNNIYAINTKRINTPHAFGINVEKNPQTLEFIENYARHSLDILYDLKWGDANETKESLSYKQRNEALNISNLYSLCQ